MARPFPRTLQELPPKWAHFCLDVEGFAAELLGEPLKGKGFVLSCSGGLDSTALLHAFLCLKQRSGLRMVVAHLDHRIRDHSDEDAQFVARRCADLGLALVSDSTDVPTLAKERSMGLEEAGRKARYEFLERVRQEYHYDYVLTAHHLDDLAEDMLMRLIRGTGWPGLAGMTAQDPHRRILRPFLLRTKSELRDFLMDLDANWREDHTNTDPAYTRNRMRMDILPRILKENPNFHQGVARLWNQGRLDQEYWDDVLEHAPVITGENGPELRQVQVVELCAAMRLRLYKDLLDSLGPGQVLAETLADLDATVMRNAHDRPALFQFPGNKLVAVKKGRLLFFLDDAPEDTL